MRLYGFCLEFLVPSEVDIGHPARRRNGRTDDPAPNPTIGAVRASVKTDGRWTLLRVSGSNPSLFVCVAVPAADEQSARVFVQAEVHGIVMDLIPGVQFVGIDPTDPNPS